MIKAHNFIIILLFLISTSCSNKISSPEQMANSLHASLKHNNFKQFGQLFAKQSDYQSWIQSQQLQPGEVEDFNNRIALLKEKGFFSMDSLSVIFNQLIAHPLKKEPDFWKHAIITEYEGVEPELNNRGIERADVYLTISGKNVSFTLRTGEMYKPGQKWIITGFPKWLN